MGRTGFGFGRDGDPRFAFFKSTQVDKLALGRNKSDIVKESLGQFLWEARFRQIKKKLAPKVESAGIITEEDVFSPVS